MPTLWSFFIVPLSFALVLTGCGASGQSGEAAAGTGGSRTAKAAQPAPGEELKRAGDEIVVAGRYFHTGTRVVLWTDPHGYDAYRVQRRFGPADQADWHDTKDKLDTPNRYGSRADLLPQRERASVRGGGWTLGQLRKIIDLLVIHYDAVGTSRGCFHVLQDQRGLSVQFMLDLDGTIYQTLDVKERAWQAGGYNSRSVGVEIANVGAYPVPRRDKPWGRWFAKDPTGRTRVTIPPAYQPSGILTPGFIARPVRSLPVQGMMDRRTLEQYDFTSAQYAALIHLAAALHKVLPRIALRAPRDDRGRVAHHTLTAARLAHFHGLVGHEHLSAEKVDPGPAFQWDRVLDGARKLLDK